VLNLCFVLVTKKRLRVVKPPSGKPRSTLPSQRSQRLKPQHPPARLGAPPVARGTRHPHEPPLVPSARRCAEGGGDEAAERVQVTGTVCLCASKICRARAGLRWLLRRVALEELGSPLRIASTES
jgi:hypothetical protein